MIIGPRLRRVLLALALTASGATHATLTVYTSQASFLSAVIGAGTDSFNDLVIGAFPASPLPRNAGPYGYTATANTAGFFVAGNGADARLSTDQFDDTITFNGFGAGVAAIGGFFFGSDLFGAALSGESVRLEVTDNDGTLQYTSGPTNSISFIGFVSDKALQSLVFSAVQSIQVNVWPTANDLVLAAGPPPPVPEPSQLVLAAVGLAVLVSRTWRRRRPAARTPAT